MNQRFDRWGSVLVCICLLYLAGLVQTASAATGDTHQQASNVEEIIVTARKRAEPLIDIPGSADALTASMIKDVGGIKSLRDLTDMIPGITVVEAASSDLMEPSIRGAGQSRNRASVSATGLYRNGAYFASESLGGRGLARMDTYDVERVEVLRGPQGALYGRNALGGAINIISKRPEDVRDFSLTTKGGGKRYWDLEGIANLPLTDALSSRVSYVHDQRNDGYFYNQDNQPVDTSKYDHVRVGLLDKPTNALDVYYSYDFEDNHYVPGIGQRFRASQTDLWHTLINTPHTTESKIANHNLVMNFNTGRGTWTSVSNFRGRTVNRLEDTDFGARNLHVASTFKLMRKTHVKADVIFQDLRFASSLGGPFEYLVGADYYNAHTREIIDDFSAGGQTIATSIFRDWKINQDSWSLYGSVNYDFKAVPLSISAEARYAKDKVNGYVYELTPNVRTTPLLDFSGANQYSNVPWDLSFSWHFRNLYSDLNEALVYFKVGTAYREGGLNLGAGLPTDAYQVKPVYNDEHSTSYEIGAKTNWFDGKFKMNASFYRVYYKHFLDTTSNGCPDLCPYLDPVTGQSLGYDSNGNRITVTASGQPGIESPTAYFIDNVGRISSWGLEVESRFNVPVGRSGGRFLGSLGWSREMGKVTEILPSVSPSEADIIGAALNFVRPQQFKASLTWRQPIALFGLDHPEFQTTLSYTMEHGGVRSISADPATLDGVDRMDARIGIDTEHWSLTLNGTNVLNNIYDIDRTKNKFRLSQPNYYYLELDWRYL